MAANASKEAEASKVTVAVDVEDVKSSKGAEEGLALAKPKKHIGGAYMSILLAAAAPCFVIFLVSGILMGLTYGAIVEIDHGYAELQLSPTPDAGPSSILSKVRNLQQHGGNDAYYIEFNPSSLTTIASWTGKLIPYLSSAMMGLAAFFVADHIRQASRAGQDDKLLTPQQMALVLGLLSGGVGQLWEIVRYRARPGNKLKDPVPLATMALVFTTALGFAIPVVDSWFGVVVTPSPQTSLSTGDITDTYSFGRGLVTNGTCTNSAAQLDGPGGTYLPCNIKMGANGPVLYSNAQAFKILNNISESHVVLPYYPSPPSQALYFLSDVAILSNNRPNPVLLDFKATTYAVSTQCQPISAKCLGDTSEDGLFNCTPSFAGNLTWSGAVGSTDSNTTSSSVGIRFFADAGLTSNFSTVGYSAQNPMYFGTWATAQMGSSLNDTNVVYTSSNGASWMLNCSATVFDVSYTWVDEAVVSFNMTAANSTVGGIFSAAFAAGLASFPLQNAAVFAGLSATSTDLAKTTANFFSQSALALAIASIAPRVNILQQSRYTKNYTRVPKIPFYVLIGFKFFYALSAILFALAVVIWAHPRESQDIKARLSFRGLAAASFEDDKFKNQAVDDLKDIFAENNPGGKDSMRKVAMIETQDGGWEYVMKTLDGGKAVTQLVEAVVKG